jgi:uridine kinase
MTEATSPAQSVVRDRDLNDRTRVGWEIRALRESRLFWVGVALKLAFAFLFGSHFATRWFAPFAYELVHGHFANPWETFLARGEPMAFPYGPGMLVIVAMPWFPALFFSFDPASHLGLLLLRLPVFAADLAICVLLMRWLRVNVRDVVLTYWLSPVVIYATYVHGQLDLIPTALLCIALFYAFKNRVVVAGLVFGLALATKLHLLIAVPFVVIYLYRQRKRPRAWLVFSAIAGATALALYAVPLTSPAFRTMVLGSTESKKLWAVAIPYGSPHLLLYLAPSAIIVAVLRFASYRKVNRELTLMFIGALYVGLVALVPPQPGWFIWSIPFVAYLGARVTRTGRFALGMLSCAYVAYFFVGDPTTFLEAANPTLGAHFGENAAAAIGSAAPWLFGPHAASIAWTLLFSATTLAGIEMYRKGVRSNSVYSFRDESFMIGIAGDSGAGKHTLVSDLAKLVGPQLSTINGDDDHKWERGHAMWRRYTHLDPRGNLLATQLEGLAALRRGGDIQKAHYDHDKGKFTDPLRIKPTDFIAIVGLHPFYLPTQRELLHLRIFVDPEESVRRSWKVDRDMQKRGYTREEVLAQIDSRAADSAKYVRPQAKYADVILRHGETHRETDVALQVELVSQLDPLLLVDALDMIPSIEVSWEPDEELTRDRITIKGTLDAEQVRVLAVAILPNDDELVYEDAWLAGGRGVAAIAVLHAMSVRLRTTPVGAKELA